MRQSSCLKSAPETAAAALSAHDAADPVEIVRAMLTRPDEELDYAEAQIAFDRIVDPSADGDWVHSELERLTTAAWEMAGPSAGDGAKLSALRKLIYESGPWNGNQAYSYDHSDPLGQHIPNMLLHNYLARRLGQCVSMPTLFLILSERLGLHMRLATAPCHVFVRYREASGRILNLETTSGALPARLSWFRHNMPMSNLALKNGIYMRSLPKREAVAHMACTVCAHLMEQGRYQEVIEIAETVLRRWRRNAHYLMLHSHVLSRIIHEEFAKRYSSPMLIPPLLRARYLQLEQRSQASYDAALRLGYEPGPDAVAVGSGGSK